MAENIGKGKGKRPIRALRGADGRFLPNLPDAPRLPLPLALEAPAQREGDGSGTPLPPGSLRFGLSEGCRLPWHRGCGPNVLQFH